VALVAVVVIASTAVGLLFERRTTAGPAAARGVLGLMLYVLVPFVSFVNIAHLRITTGAGAGLAVAYVAIGTAGLIAWLAARGPLALDRPGQGALICSVILVNTGYLGLPMTVALLGTHALSSAVAYDQVVSGPMLFVIGFGIGAAFGSVRDDDRGTTRIRAFILRNPPLLAVIAGLIAPPAAAPAILVHASHVVVVALLPLGFFTVGVNLSAERRAEGAPLIEAPDRRVIVAVALRLLVPVSILAAFSSTVVALPSAYLLLAAMPTAVNSLLVGHAYGLDQRLLATIIVWSTATVLLVGVIASAI
jgi:malate permease and related proteins